jgi:hypothetical protein
MGCGVPPSPDEANYGGTLGVVSNEPGADYRNVTNNVGIDYAAELLA